MGRLSAGVIAVLACVSALAPAAASAKAPGGCAERGTTVEASSQARVYWVPAKGDQRVYRGCVTGGRSFELGRRAPSTATNYSDPFFEQVQLGGRIVTYANETCGPSDGTFGCRHDARSVNLRTGKVIAQDSFRGSDFVLVAATNGSFATANFYGIGPEQDVTFTTPDGTTQLDHGGPTGPQTGTRVDPSSLAVGDGTVYWLRDGAPRSAAVETGFGHTPQPATGHAKRRKDQLCKGPGRTIAADGTSRIYSVGKRYHRSYYACRFGSGQRLLLMRDRGWDPNASVFGGDTLYDAFARGRFITYSRIKVGFGSNAAPRIRSVDLATGKIVSHLSLPSRGWQVFPLAGGSFVFSDSAPAVDVVGPGGVRLLDSGPPLDSVAVAPHQVYWIKDGETRSAPLP